MGCNRHKPETDISSRLSVCQKICVLSVILFGCDVAFPNSTLTSLFHRDEISPIAFSS